MSKVYDCVMAFNETDMLELRLQTLYDVVDQFVIVEAGQTHSGQPKPSWIGDALQSERFAPYADKVIYHYAATLQGDHSWTRERNHRGLISSVLRYFAAPEDLIVVGDVDEIPNPDIIPSIGNMATLELDFMYYSFHHRVKMGWGIGACRWGVCQDANAIRRGEFGVAAPTIPNAGWHLSYLMQPEQVVEKIRAFMHHDWADNDPRVLNRDYIAEKMRTGGDIWGRDLEIEYVQFPENLPHPVRENPNKYVALGWLERQFEVQLEGK